MDFCGFWSFFRVGYLFFGLILSETLFNFVIIMLFNEKSRCFPLLAHFREEKNTKGRKFILHEFKKKIIKHFAEKSSSVFNRNLQTQKKTGKMFYNFFLPTFM